VRLHVLGSNGTYPSPGRPASGYAVETGDTLVWLDAGPGTFTALWDRFDLESVDAIVVSHEHPDHCLDLLSAYHALAYGPERYPAIPVYSPEPVVTRLRSFLRAGEGHAIDSIFAFRPVGDGDRVVIGDIAVEFRTTDHSVPCVGARMEADGRVLAYSADTGPKGAWDALAEGADLFLCEASYQGDGAGQAYTQHLTATQAGTIARRRSARKLMLTHIPAHFDIAVSAVEAEAAFDRPVAVAVPGTTHDL
jgi:ribonuclease BN (tRNA processing enzyme)